MPDGNRLPRKRTPKADRRTPQPLITAERTRLSQEAACQLRPVLEIQLANSRAELKNVSIGNIEVQRPTFYPDILFFHCDVESRGKPIGCATFAQTDDDLILFDGIAAHIHALNLSTRLLLDDVDKVRAYLQFFCGGIQGDGAVFRIVEDFSKLPWKVGAPRNVAALLGRATCPIAIDEVASAEGRTVWKADAFVLYRDVLFTSSFIVQPTGTVDMTQDEAHAQNLPVGIERYDGGIRRVD